MNSGKSVIETEIERVEREKDKRVRKALQSTTYFAERIDALLKEYNRASEEIVNTIYSEEDSRVANRIVTYLRLCHESIKLSLDRIQDNVESAQSFMDFERRRNKWDELGGDKNET
jgi:HD superfamily phosphodiesterase